jgi:hypothetical protein
VACGRLPSCWRRVDYDARIPGAGTLLSQFYAYGQLMLHQQQVWNGPVFSEGGNHWYYAGLITGSFAQDRGYNLASDPWLVDFDLRQLHPLGCDVGFVVPVNGCLVTTTFSTPPPFSAIVVNPHHSAVDDVAPTAEITNPALDFLLPLPTCMWGSGEIRRKAFWACRRWLYVAAFLE